jgi:predicted Zn-dependent peptidase
MYQQQTLQNGLRILMVPVHSFQSVSAGIFVGVGSRYESETEAGISHFIEHMLFKGTTTRPTSKLISEAIEGIGGYNNAYTDYETTVYYAKVAASHARTAVGVLADLVRQPLFEPKEIEKERQVIGEEINMMYDSPDDWVEVLIDQVFWPDHPLGHSIAGTHQSLANLNRDTLLAYYRRSYHPENILVAIAGTFDPDEVMSEVESVLGDWGSAGRPTFQAAPPRQTEPRWYVEDRSIEQGHLCLALPGLARTHPDRYALSVLNTILGEGMSSRLFLNIREDRGLAYAVDSSLTMLQDAGCLVIYAGVDPERAPEALQAILDELHRLVDEPVPAQELHKAKEFLKGRLVLSLENSFSWANWVAYQSLFFDTIKTPAEVLSAYDAVTAADIHSVAQSILRPAAYNLAAIGPFGPGEALGQLIRKTPV